jgi:putative nucleotidyltransferase with HDIG domain
MPEVELRLERLLFNLNALAELGEEITSQKDFHRVAKSCLFMVMGTFSSSKGAIFRYDTEKKAINPLVSKGLVKSGKNTTIALSEGDVKEMVECGKPMDIRSEPISGTIRAELEKHGARIIVPLLVKDEFLGLIFINEKLSGEDFNAYDFRLLSAMVHHIAVSFHSHSLLTKLMHKYSENKVLYENLSRIYYDTVFAFATAIDAKDAYTKGHSHRVSAYCSALANEMGLPVDEVEGIRVAGLLHDIGKIAIDKTIINKSSPLTIKECNELNSHPVVGYDILSKIKFPWGGIQRMIRNHHEKIDGTGYPDGLKRKKIPLGARMMAMVDAFDAMTTDRPYRSKLSFREVMVEIKDNLGKQFDPFIVQSFLSAIRKEVTGEVARPSITPHLREHLNSDSTIRLLDGFLAGNRLVLKELSES